MDRDTAERYLDRIGLADAPPLTLDGLRTLQLAHLRTVPFENLSIHLGEPIVLDEDLLAAKIVDRRRGGFCYELNGLFAALLRALGHRVDLLQARVHGDGGPSFPFDHLILRVDLDGPWLVDVGFGRSAHHPLRLDTDADQPDPDGIYRIAEAPHGDLDVLRDGEPQLRVDPRPRDLAEFTPGCWWHRTSPDSHFTRGDVCSMLTENGRISLKGDTLITTAADGTKTTERLADPLAAYTERFGLTIPRLPTRHENGRNEG